ncbi:MAG: amino acid permease, partial [Gammaproteobacteria bacterium]|nr:amino acid permease [Gammaproteobacteria bacterium]
FMPQGWVSVLAGAVTDYFSLTGAEITTIAAAESQEPARAVARMSTTVIVRILTFYVGSVLLIVSVVPWTSVRVGESPFTLALTTMQFRWASLAMSVIILTAVLSCLNSAFYVCSRVLFVLAEHGDAPQWLVQLNARRVPTRSVWMGSLAGVLGILAATASSQTVFAFLVNASGALMVFIYMMITVAHIRLRRQREAAGAPAPALSMWFFPWASYAALAGMTAVLIGMALTPAMTADLKASILSLALAVLAFLLVNSRRRARAAQPVAGTVGP